MKSYILLTRGERGGPRKRAGLPGCQPAVRNSLLCSRAGRRGLPTAPRSLPVRWSHRQLVRPTHSSQQKTKLPFFVSTEPAFLQLFSTHLIVLLSWNVLSKVDTCEKWLYWALMTPVSHTAFPKVSIHPNKKKKKQQHSTTRSWASWRSASSNQSRKHKSKERWYSFAWSETRYVPQMYEPMPGIKTKPEKYEHHMTK